MRGLIIGLLMFLASCATPQVPLQEIPDNSLCENAEGYEYVCYNTAECREYLSGYAAVIRERYLAQKDGWFVEDGDKQKVDINLFYDHQGLYLIGYIIGTREDNRVWLQVTTWVCDIEGNLTYPPATLGGYAEWTL